jgi:glycosyltransferase involved in cell wall biosynthesis
MSQSADSPRPISRGRDKFKAVKPFLHFCVLLLRLMPTCLCCLLLRLVRYFTGHFGMGIRYILLSRLASHCGDNVSLHDAVYLKHISKLSIGNHVSIHPMCYLDAQGGLEIGDDVSIAHNVSILSFEHDFGDLEKPIKDAPCLPRKITIENNIWIGAGVRILGGVTIGGGSVVGAGSVVTKDIPPMSVAVGVPARVIKTRQKTVKIAHTVTAYGSVITILDTKLRGLNAFNDLEVTVISSPKDFEEGRKPSVRHLEVEIPRNISPIKDLKSIWSMYHLFKAEKFDIVHSHTAKAGFVTAIAGWLAGVPRVYHTSHGLPFFDGQGKIKKQIYRTFEKMACRLRHHFFTQNQRDMEACIDLMGSADKVTFEGNGVDVELIEKNAVIQRDAAEKLYGTNGIRIVMLARLEPVKRIEDFIEALVILKERKIDMTSVIAGSGPLSDYLVELIETKGVQDIVSLVGGVTFPHGLIAASDIVVLCSEKEGIPRCLMEAMALRKPVVATDVLGTQELVQNEQTGFLVPLGDVFATAEKIQLLIDSEDLRRRFGQAGHHRVIHHYNDVNIAKMLHDFYVQDMRP